jgi:hypothetical protein
MPYRIPNSAAFRSLHFVLLFPASPGWIQQHRLPAKTLRISKLSFSKGAYFRERKLFFPGRGTGFVGNVKQQGGKIEKSVFYIWKNQFLCVTFVSQLNLRFPATHPVRFPILTFLYTLWAVVRTSSPGGAGEVFRTMNTSFEIVMINIAHLNRLHNPQFKTQANRKRSRSSSG